MTAMTMTMMTIGHLFFCHRFVRRIHPFYYYDYYIYYCIYNNTYILIINILLKYHYVKKNI